MFSVVPQDRQRRWRLWSLIRGYGVATRVMVISKLAHFATICHTNTLTHCPSKGTGGLIFSHDIPGCFFFVKPERVLLQFGSLN
jgi:hypothetical protein